MRGSVTSRHSFVYIVLPSSLFHELIIFFCSLLIYFPTSFSFACFSHCLFFVCSDLLFLYSIFVYFFVYFFSFPALHFIIRVFLFFSVCLFFAPRCVGCLFLFPLFLGVFVSSPVSIFSLRVYIFCRGFPFLFHTHFLFAYLFLFVFSLACSISLFLSSLPIICSVFQYSFLLVMCYADQLDT